MMSPQKSPVPGSLAADGSRALQNTCKRNLTPRMVRLAKALLSEPQTASDLMRAAPCNNSGQYIKTLRERYGLTIPCKHIDFITIDGAPSWYGEYSLTDEDRVKLQAIVQGEQGYA